MARPRERHIRIHGHGLRLDANFFSCPILIWCSAQKVVAGPHTNRSVAHIKFCIQMCTHAAASRNQLLTPKLEIIITL